MREADVPATVGGPTFRYSSARATVAVLLVLGAAGALVVAGRVHGAWPAYAGAAILLLLLWIFSRMILARFEPTNWLLRIGADGLYLKFRSYLNHDFPEGDPTVALIHFRDIRRARLIRETRTVPQSDGTGTTWQRRSLVELELSEDAPELSRALAAERAMKGPTLRRWYGSSTSRYRHYPVRMPSPRSVEIEWGVVPRAPELLRVLAAHADVESLDRAKDYSQLRGLDRTLQESRLRELVESGETITAIGLARSLYGYDHARAKAFVDGLAGGKEA